MVDHQFNGGVLQKRRWGLIFIKGARGFETNFELEAHNNAGAKEEDGDGEEMGGEGRKFEGKKGRKGQLAS